MISPICSKCWVIGQGSTPLTPLGIGWHHIVSQVVWSDPRVRSLTLLHLLCQVALQFLGCQYSQVILAQRLKAISVNMKFVVCHKNVYIPNVQLIRL